MPLYLVVSIHAAEIFIKPDMEAIASLNQKLMFVGRDATERTAEMLRQSVTEALSGKYTREEYINVLRERFKQYENTAPYRLEAAADLHLNQARHIARINQAESARIKYFRVRAVIDHKTTRICRSMNGRIIQIGHLTAQRDALHAAKTIDEVKQAVTLYQTSEVADIDLLGPELPKSVGIPPYHFRCRTEIHAVNIKTAKVDDKEVSYTSAGPGDMWSEAGGKAQKKRVVFSHIDKTGVERVVTEKTIYHSDSEKPTPAKMIAGLNSITDIAPHAEWPGRYVALSQNHIVFIFEGQYVVTVVQRTAKNDRKYYKKSAITGKGKVIKWNAGNVYYQLATTITSLMKRLWGNKSH